jgi:hypothetical protein
MGNWVYLIASPADQWFFGHTAYWSSTFLLMSQINYELYELLLFIALLQIVDFNQFTCICCSFFQGELLLLLQDWSMSSWRKMLSFAQQTNIQSGKSPIFINTISQSVFWLVLFQTMLLQNLYINPQNTAQTADGSHSKCYIYIHHHPIIVYMSPFEVPFPFILFELSFPMCFHLLLQSSCLMSKFSSIMMTFLRKSL